MTSWVKLHCDILGDRKLMRASRRGVPSLNNLPWLIVFAKAADDDGRLSVGGEPAEAIDISEQIPSVTEAEVERCMVECEGLGILERDADGALRFAAWERRQSKPSDSPAAINERVKKHRLAKRGTSEDGNTVKRVTGVTSETPCNATEEEAEIDGDKDNPPTPLRADAPAADAARVEVGVVSLTHANGTNGQSKTVAKRNTGPPAARSVEQITSRLAGFLAEVGSQAEREVKRDELRGLMIDLVFAYWAKKTRHDGAKLDRKRFSVLRQRLIESSDNVHQLLYVTDGALKDDTIMGRRSDSSRKYDGVSTLYRDFEQVERLATLGGFTEGKAHPAATKYLSSVLEPAGAA